MGMNVLPPWKGTMDVTRKKQLCLTELCFLDAFHVCSYVYSVYVHGCVGVLSQGHGYHNAFALLICW